MMAVSKEERIDLVLLSGREGWSHHKIAEEFNLQHPYWQLICYLQCTQTSWTPRIYICMHKTVYEVYKMHIVRDHCIA